jgi:hypothetical protein
MEGQRWVPRDPHNTAWWISAFRPGNFAWLERQWLRGEKRDLRPKGWSSAGLRRRMRAFTLTNELFNLPPGPSGRRPMQGVPGFIRGEGIVPGNDEFYDKWDHLITDAMLGPAPAVYHRLYPGEFPPFPLRMFEHDDEENPRGLGGAQVIKRIITMLRVWYRKAIRRLTETFGNTRLVSLIQVNSLPFNWIRRASAAPLRLTWNRVLEDRSARRGRFS